LSGLAESQPVHRKTRLQVWQSLLLVAERQHRHASLDGCAVLDRVNPIRDQVTLGWFALPDGSIKQFGPSVASALVIAAQFFEAQTQRNILPDGVAFVAMNPALPLLQFNRVRR